jgi:NAD(P)H dehydrogenase (quinone)
MSDVNVLVTFFSRTGSTENLALAAALGAVNARAKIRLRWLREDVADEALDRVPGWRENRERMAREYIAPREIDVVWADALVLAMPMREDVTSPEVLAHLELLRALHSSRKLHGKVGTAFAPESQDEPFLTSLCSALTEFDLILIPLSPTAATDAREAARLHGRGVAEIARALKR